MNFSVSGLFASLLFSSLGLIVFKRGRSETNNFLVAIGILLFFYTYFTSSPLADWGIGLALTGGAYHYWNG
jgi:MFS-type transporter involved in bile tolerance (Atg22 family)